LIVYVTGSIRAGKTYFVMQYIASKFLIDEDERKKIPSFTKNDGIVDNKKRCITNFKLHNNIEEKLENTKKIKYKDLYASLVEIYEYSMEEEPTDADLTEFAEKFEVANSIIALDEVQNYFSKEDKVLIWFLSYCGHMNVTIFLVTQDFDLIHNKYKKICQEWFIRAIPQSTRIFKGMVYARYKSPKLYKADEFPDRFKVPINQAVFDLYEHGTVNKNSSQTLKIFLKALFFIVLAILAFMGVGYYWSLKSSTSSKPKDEIEDIKPKVSKAPVEQATQQRFISNVVPKKITQKKVIKIICNKQICIYQDIKIPYGYFKKIVNIEKIEIIYKEKLEMSYSIYFLKVKDNFISTYLNFNLTLEKAKKNENNNTIFSSSSNFSLFN